MENRAEALAVSDLRPVLDENAPCPSANTPTHVQASCGARDLRARFDQRERVSSKGACDRRARTKSERRSHHASEPNALWLTAKTPPHLSANRGARNLRARFDQRERVSS